MGKKKKTKKEEREQAMKQREEIRNTMHESETERLRKHLEEYNNSPTTRGEINLPEAKKMYKLNREYNWLCAKAKDFFPSLDKVWDEDRYSIVMDDICNEPYEVKMSISRLNLPEEVRKYVAERCVFVEIQRDFITREDLALYQDRDIIVLPRGGLSNDCGMSQLASAIANAYLNSCSRDEAKTVEELIDEYAHAEELADSWGWISAADFYR